MQRRSKADSLFKKQLFAMMFVDIMGTGLIGLPSLMVRQSGQDGWISLLIAGGISLVTLNAILFFMKRYPDMSIVEISEKLLGKYLGKLPGILLFVYFLFFTAIAIRTMLDLVTTSLLPTTPIDILAFILFFLCVYGIRNGMKVVGRFTEVMILLVLPIFILFIVPPFLHRNMLNILPVGGSGLGSIARASIPGLYAFTGFECLFLLYPYARKNADHKDIVKVSNACLLVSIILKTIVVMGSILVFGAPELKHFVYALVEYFKVLTFPIVERVEFLLVYFWIFMFFGATLVLWYLATLTLEKTIKLENYKNTSLFLVVPLYFLFLYPKNISTFLNIYVYNFGAVGIGIVWFLLIGLSIVGFIRRKVSDA